jgi:hypothetical protein
MVLVLSLIAVPWFAPTILLAIRLLMNRFVLGMSNLLLESVLVCPVCGFAKRETMPTDACQFFYECTSCKALLRPKPGDCCVFCSYGSVKCPPMQKERDRMS